MINSKVVKKIRIEVILKSNIFKLLFCKNDHDEHKKPDYVQLFKSKLFWTR